VCSSPGGREDGRADELPDRIQISGVVFGAGVLGLSIALPWVRITTGDEVRYLAAVDLSWIAWLLIAGAVSGVLSAVIECIILRRSCQIALAVSLSTIGLMVVLIAVIENVSSWVPRTLLPTTIRRLTLDVGAAGGIWVALVGGAIGASAASGLMSQGMRVLRSLYNSHEPSDRARLAGICAILLGLPGAVAARYQPWIDSAVNGHSASVAGWAIPYVGPGSLALVWCLIAVSCVAVVRQNPFAALLGGVLCWALLSASLVMAVTADSVGPTVLERVPLELRRLGPKFNAGRGPLLASIAAAVLVVGFALLIKSASTREGNDGG